MKEEKQLVAVHIMRPLFYAGNEDTQLGEPGQVLKVPRDVPLPVARDLVAQGQATALPFYACDKLPEQPAPAPPADGGQGKGKGKGDGGQGAGS